MLALPCCQFQLHSAHITCHSRWEFFVLIAPCVVVSGFFIINNESLQHAFSDFFADYYTTSSFKIVWPLRNWSAFKTVAFQEQHPVLSAVKVEEKPSCGMKLLTNAAWRHQHEESISLWRSFLSSLGLILPLASWSVKTKEKVNL